MVRVRLFAGARLICFLVASKPPHNLLFNAYLVQGGPTVKLTTNLSFLLPAPFGVYEDRFRFQIGMNHNLCKLADLQCL